VRVAVSVELGRRGLHHGRGVLLFLLLLLVLRHCIRLVGSPVRGRRWIVLGFKVKRDFDRRAVLCQSCAAAAWILSE